MSYHHFTIDDRESILIYRTKGLNFSQIGKLLFLILFTKDPKKQTSELGSVIGKQIRLQGKTEKLA